MAEVRDINFYARRYAAAFKLFKKYKDNPNHWAGKRLKYAIIDLQEAALKVGDRRNCDV